MDSFDQSEPQMENFVELKLWYWRHSKLTSGYWLLLAQPVSWSASRVKSFLRREEKKDLKWCSVKHTKYTTGKRLNKRKNTLYHSLRAFLLWTNWWEFMISVQKWRAMENLHHSNKLLCPVNFSLMQFSDSVWSFASTPKVSAIRSTWRPSRPSAFFLKALAWLGIGQPTQRHFHRDWKRAIQVATPASNQASWKFARWSCFEDWVCRQ